MRFPRKLAFFLVLLGGLALGLLWTKPYWQASLGKQEVPPDFIGLVEGETTAELQTAIAGYRSRAGVTVDLVGAVHLADAAYYETLNARFREYDAVLFELVGNPDDLLDDEAESAPSIVRWLQQSLVGILDLTFQLEGIDYTAANFVHADLSDTEFRDRMKERGETIFTILTDLAQAQAQSQDGQSLAAQPSAWQLMRAFFSSDRADRLKLIAAKQFEQAEAIFANDKDSIIISERNQRVIDVLEQQIAAGKHKIAIFYGAGHLLDLDQRLLKLKFRRQTHEWVTAWEIAKPIQASRRQQ